MSIRISALICTLNRVHYLRKAIKSLYEQTIPQESYEIIVVDNGSEDNTKKLVTEELSHIENLRYINEISLYLVGLKELDDISYSSQEEGHGQE